LQRVHIAAILGKKTPNAARNWMKALRGLMKFCVEAELIEGHPTEGIKRARTPKTGGFHTWTEPEIAKYEARHPIGTCERLAEALLLYTALGRSDIVRFGPQHVQGSRIELRKTARLTGKTLRIAIHPALAEVIAGTPCNHLTFLVTAYEKPLTAPGFGNWFRECCDAAGLPHCTAHGLRKAMFRRIAKAGGSVHHLKGVGGHASLSELQVYTEDADQARLAQDAMDLVARAFPDKPGTQTG